MNVIISGVDAALILKFYNSALAFKNLGYPLKTNEMILRKIRLDNRLPEIKEKMLIKFLSPLIVRKREDNKDTYLVGVDEEFEKYINISIYNLFDSLGIKDIYNPIKLTPIDAKKTVIKSDGLMFNATFGNFIIEGDKNVISVLYQAGIGSRRAQGFGLFEIVGG
jgi:CRISPR-associated endoribonuclease Cas6